MGYRISLTYVYSATWIVRGPFLLRVLRSFLILSRVAVLCREIRMAADVSVCRAVRLRFATCVPCVPCAGGVNVYSTCISNIIVNTLLLFTFCTSSSITYDVSCAGPHPHRDQTRAAGPCSQRDKFQHDCG